jgi:hypothetical protein
VTVIEKHSDMYMSLSLVIEQIRKSLSPTLIPIARGTGGFCVWQGLIQVRILLEPLARECFVVMVNSVQCPLPFQQQRIDCVRVRDSGRLCRRDAAHHGWPG